MAAWYTEPLARPQGRDGFDRERSRQESCARVVEWYRQVSRFRSGEMRGTAYGQSEAVAGEFMVYAIGFPVRGVHDRLIRLSEDTGGGHFVLMDDAALASTFEGVVDELHHQYAIGFVPVVRDGKTHTLAIKIAGRGLTVRARNSYVAAVQ